MGIIKKIPKGQEQTIINSLLTGTIISEKEVVISAEGYFLGNVMANRLQVKGQIKGNLEVNELHIVEGGKVDGVLKVGCLKIDDGGLFMGKCHMAEKSEAYAVQV